MKLPNLLRRKKLRASTARRSLGLPDEMDYEEMSEPNMKLSRALLIVLLLHVVAVAGIIAFNAIKTRQGPPPATATASSAQTAAAKSQAPTLSDSVPVRRAEPSTVRSPAKSVAKDERKSDHAKPTESSTKPDGKTYVVAKGDNPVTIARKFKISYDELLAANHIDDPHKLQIGQKLIIPTKAAKTKKSE